MSPREEVYDSANPQITMVCTGVDGSGNTASASVIADFSQPVTPKRGGAEDAVSSI